MPRKLPWLSDGLRVKHEGAPLSTASTPPPRQRDNGPEDLVDANLDPTAPNTAPRRKKKRTVRTPSASPPPAPPDVEFMREGYDADDIYMMVEDELWSTAKLFTQHLHHAEYERFKKLAASRGANVLDALARPVDGRTEQSGSLKMQIEAEKKAKRIKAALKQATGKGDTSSGEEDDFMYDTHLAGLMTGDSRPSNKLCGLSKPQSNTRAAAGLTESCRHGKREKAAERFIPRQDSSTDDDDLGRLALMPKRLMEKRPICSTAGEHGQGDLRGSRTERGASAFVKVQRYSKEPVITDAKSDFTTDKQKTSAAWSFLAKRRAEREKREQEEKRKVKSEIEIPTFAI